MVGLPVAVALFVTARQDARAAEADRLVALGREREALVQVAVSRERMAMARELHDIAAHHLTGIAVMTGAMERQIDVAPADAKVAVRHVRSQFPGSGNPKSMGALPLHDTLCVHVRKAVLGT